MHSDSSRDCLVSFSAAPALVQCPAPNCSRPVVELSVRDHSTSEHRSVDRFLTAFFVASSVVGAAEPRSDA
eukprot:2468646-Rhodomonas_salina.3